MKSTRPESYHEVWLKSFHKFRCSIETSFLFTQQCELCQHPYLFTRSGWTRALDSEMFILFITAIFFALLLLIGETCSFVRG